MSTSSAHKTLIGAFVLGALALLVVTIAVIGSGTLLSEPIRFVMFFDSSLKGLTPGSPVAFRGVPIGRVAEIRMAGNFDDMHFRIPVFVDLDPVKGEHSSPFTALNEEPEVLQRLFDKGLRARLNTQSLLTGQLIIELDFYPTEMKQLTTSSIKSFDDYYVIPTIPSQFDTVWQRIASLPIDKIASNLLSISEHVNAFLELPGMEDLPRQLNATLSEFETLGKKLNVMATQFDAAAPGEMKRIHTLLDNYTRLAAQLEQGAASASAVLGPNTVTVIEITRAARELSDAARAIRSLASMLEREPEALLLGKGDKR